ncbi:hypothetical protein M5K25_002967 [Dendrobium thyrsiflorum]|uniref:Uncharacterized protein n=1 Tax=Dendrobium thyrsiflorum TaxID=117978 RepID=A0ABD0VPZ9_DENTH
MHEITDRNFPLELPTEISLEITNGISDINMVWMLSDPKENVPEKRKESAIGMLKSYRQISDKFFVDKL